MRLLGSRDGRTRILLCSKHFFSVITKEQSVNKIERDAPARRFARVYDASVGACNYESVDNKERCEKEKKPLNRNALLTSGHSTVSAFMFMT